MGSDGIPGTTLSAAARRMRRHRRRRHNGLHLVHIWLKLTELETLIRKGYLEDQQRGDPVAIQDAAEIAISDALQSMGGERNELLNSACAETGQGPQSDRVGP